MLHSEEFFVQIKETKSTNTIFPMEKAHPTKKSWSFDGLDQLMSLIPKLSN